MSESQREFYARQARCHGQSAALLVKAVNPEYLGFTDGEEWKIYDWARIAGHYGLLALRKPCGCDEDDPMCFHGIPEYDWSGPGQWIGIDRSTVPTKS